MFETQIPQRLNTTMPLQAETFSVQVADKLELVRAAKNLCHDVYLRVGYIDKPFVDRIIPYEYESNSIYIVAMTSSDEVAGTVRLTQGTPFKTLDVWKNNLYTSCTPLINAACNGRSVEIGALAVNKNFRAMKVSSMLYGAAYRWCKSLKIGYAFISMDLRACHAMEMQGWNVIKIGEPINYFGSLTVPGIIPVNEQRAAVVKESRHIHHAA